MATVRDLSGNSPIVTDPGLAFDPDKMDQTFAYDGSGNLITITITDGINTWVKTFTYVDSAIATVSDWVLQD